MSGGNWENFLPEYHEMVYSRFCGSLSLAAVDEWFSLIMNPFNKLTLMNGRGYEKIGWSTITTLARVDTIFFAGFSLNTVLANQNA
mmetsp:Transcript_2504/g.2618  ORF Transcript_2504/g.2618 Transcript_2504/m.2618 type:complete len:86 (-) Transcript_2504:99-356(-)